MLTSRFSIQLNALPEKDILAGGSMDWLMWYYRNILRVLILGDIFVGELQWFGLGYSY